MSSGKTKVSLKKPPAPSAPRSKARTSIDIDRLNAKVMNDLIAKSSTLETKIKIEAKAYKDFVAAVGVKNNPPSGDDIFAEDDLTIKTGNDSNFRVAYQVIDIFLSPEEAEEVIGDLIQSYEVRLRVGRGHAARWIWAQTARIILFEIFNLVRRFALAKAGKPFR